MNLANFSMDTITLAGSLERKLGCSAERAAQFAENDFTNYPTLMQVVQL